LTADNRALAATCTDDFRWVDTKAVAAFTLGIISHIDDLGTKHLVLASLTVGEIIGNNIPAPFHPAAYGIYKDLELLK